MRVTVVSPAFRGGGAERLACLLASAWARQGREVTLLSFDRADAPAFPIDPSVTLQGLDLLAFSSNHVEGLWRNLRRMLVLRRAIRNSRPDVVISFVNKINVVTLLATRGLTSKVVISEVTDPGNDPCPRIWSILRKMVYPWAAMLVCPTPRALAWFPKNFRARGRVIPCPVAPPPQSASIAVQNDHCPPSRVLIGMGRLVPEKGFDMLLSAFAHVASHHPEWSLKIIGAGRLKTELEAQARDLKLTDRIIFTGELADPFPMLCAADLFVLSSRFEGFGLALCEAMACGLPVVSFDCPSGPRNIIRHGVDGILVPPEDINLLAEVLDRLMTDRQERERLAAHAPTVLDRFGTDKILPLWQEIFDELALAEGGELRSTSRCPSTRLAQAAENQAFDAGVARSTASTFDLDV